MARTPPAVSQMREGLARNVGAMDGIDSYAYAKDSCNPIEVVVQPPEEITYNRTFGGGAEYTFPVRIYAGRVSEREAQDALDLMVSERGKLSLKVALESDQSLGCGANWVQVRTMRRYGAYTVGDVEYLGAELVVAVSA